MSAAATAYWVAFAKSANPGSAGGPAWPKYSQGEPVLEFGIDGIHPRTKFHSDRLDWMEEHSGQVSASAATAGVPVVAARTTGFGRGAAPASRTPPPR